MEVADTQDCSGSVILGHVWTENAKLLEVKPQITCAVERKANDGFLGILVLNVVNAIIAHEYQKEHCAFIILVSRWDVVEVISTVPRSMTTHIWPIRDS